MPIYLTILKQYISVTLLIHQIFVIPYYQHDRTYVKMI